MDFSTENLRHESMKTETGGLDSVSISFLKGHLEKNISNICKRQMICR